MSQASITGSLVRLSIFAPEHEWLSVFDRIEVWRSMSGPSGPYEEVTAGTWAPAQVPAGTYTNPSPPVSGRLEFLVGKTLTVKALNGVVASITFIGVDPITRAEAASQVVSKSNGLLTAFVSDDGTFILRSTVPGSSSVLEVLPTEAAGLLGLPSSPPASVGYGRDYWVTLEVGEEVYSFTDIRGGSSAFYKTRYRNSITGVVGEYSAPIPAVPTGIPALPVVVGYADIVDASGRPTANREVRVEADFTQLTSAGQVIAGIHEEGLTDRLGHVEFVLVRGATLQVGVAGTRMARTITVPTDPSIERFNLFDPQYGSDDLFNVQVPNVDFAVRSAP